MPKLGRVTRAYPLIQTAIRQWLETEMPITTFTLQQHYFGNDFSQHDIRQLNTISECVRRGRKNAEKKWTFFTRSPEFDIELANILETEPLELQEVTKSEEFMVYKAVAITGELGEEIKLGIGNGDIIYPAIAVLFNQNINQYSKEGHNLLIASGGPNSQWILPSYWRWGIYLRDTSMRILKGLRTIITDAIATKALPPSGELFQIALDLTTTVRASLMDSTSWTCSHCNARNIEERSECAICNTPKP